MTLAELLEKSRDIPGNSDVFAVPVADERNRAGATFEVVDVFFDLDNTPIKPTFCFEKIARVDYFHDLTKMIASRRLSERLFLFLAGVNGLRSSFRGAAVDKFGRF